MSNPGADSEQIIAVGRDTDTNCSRFSNRSYVTITIAVFTKHALSVRAAKKNKQTNKKQRLTEIDEQPAVSLPLVRRQRQDARHVVVEEGRLLLQQTFFQKYIYTVFIIVIINQIIIIIILKHLEDVFNFFFSEKKNSI